MAPLAGVSTAAARTLTYEQYMTEGEVCARYDIVDGVRIFMPGATWRHQRVADNVLQALRSYERASGAGLAVSAPFDVMVQRTPLRTRQPDVLFISRARLAQAGGVPEEGVLEVAPELVVEVVSSRETARIVQDKINDYAAVGVSEVWLLRSAAQTVEQLRLTPAGAQPVGSYSAGAEITSLAFPGLVVPVSGMFAA